MASKTCNFDCSNCHVVKESIFKHADEESIVKIAASKVVMPFKTGQILFSQGAASHGVFCIESGKIKLSKVDEEGNESIISIAAGGDFIGYRGISNHREYEVTATAIEEGRSCYMRNESLDSLLLLKPIVTMDLLSKTIKTMEDVYTYGHASIHKNAKNRVAILIKLMGDKFGINDGDSIKLDLHLTRHEMACMVGTASETVIRSISDLKKKGIIDQKGSTIVINDMKKLARISKMSNA